MLDALFPAGTLLMQAEDFDGAWQVNPRWDWRQRSAWAGGTSPPKARKNNDGIKRSVLISQPGQLLGVGAGHGIGSESGLRTSVGGKPLGVTHAQGPMDELAACRHGRPASRRDGNRRPRRRARPTRSAMRC